jgi:hypothetical protein
LRGSPIGKDPVAASKTAERVVGVAMSAVEEKIKLDSKGKDLEQPTTKAR